MQTSLKLEDLLSSKRSEHDAQMWYMFYPQSKEAQSNVMLFFVVNGGMKATFFVTSERIFLSVLDCCTLINFTYVSGS